MGRKRLNILFVTLLLLPLLGGCRRQAADTQPLVRVVTRIDVVTSQGSSSYTSEEKMNQILDCLRLIRPSGTPALAPVGDETCITLHFSDGGEVHYRQMADCFWQNQGSWVSIDPERGEQLLSLIDRLPSD